MVLKSAKAIIIVNDKYLLQLRDNNKKNYFPNYWGLFGGQLNKNETYSNAAKREIKEEINLNIKIFKKIFSVNFNIIGLKKRRSIIYYECKIKKQANIILAEGQKYKFFSFNKIKKLKIVPIDFVAINAHYYKNKNYPYSYK